jgi:hypothetical protein
MEIWQHFKLEQSWYLCVMNCVIFNNYRFHVQVSCCTMIIQFSGVFTIDVLFEHISVITLLKMWYSGLCTQSITIGGLLVYVILIIRLPVHTTSKYRVIQHVKMICHCCQIRWFVQTLWVNISVCEECTPMEPLMCIMCCIINIVIFHISIQMQLSWSNVASISSSDRVPHC